MAPDVTALKAADDHIANALRSIHRVEDERIDYLMSYVIDGLVSARGYIKTALNRVEPGDYAE